MLTPLQTETIALARSYLGTREQGKNTGKDIDKWLAFCRCNPGDPYCASYVSYCIHKAAVSVPPQFLPSASALRLATRNSALLVTRDDAGELLDAGIPLVFVQDHGKGKGHAGFALGFADEGGYRLQTLEANTGPGPNAPAADRDGDGVYERTDRGFDEMDFFLGIS